ncbi:hypothetical protein RZS08_52545, partial [Arthrospira platensis SPKY1]|nr:hypothetical protein [Arthrospira platensis SPKY1]
MRNQIDQKGLWCWLLAGFILTGLIACVTAGRTGRTTPHLGEYTLIATGRTTNHTADWICVNDTREPMLFQLDPGILYGPEEYQPLIFTDPISVTVPPKTTATFP